MRKKPNKEISALRRYDNIQRVGEKEAQTIVRKWFALQFEQVSSGIKQIMKDTTTQLADWDALEEKGKVLWKPFVLETVKKAGEATMLLNNLELTFDYVNADAIATVEGMCVKLVREVTEETKDAIRSYINHGLMTGKGSLEVGRKLRPLVGLTERQMMSVANHEESLLKLRPDLSRKEIDRRVGVYERRLHRKRAEMIARTETARARNEGILLAMVQSQVGKVRWKAHAGACELCEPMNGEIFTLGQATGTLPYHPNCKCLWLAAE